MSLVDEASTVELSKPFVPFLEAVMERLVGVERSFGGFNVRARETEAIIQRLLPELNRCSECEQMIVVGAYIRACLSLDPAQCKDYLPGRPCACRHGCSARA